jgi:3-hydroxyisobutyrate dehydrogenase
LRKGAIVVDTSTISPAAAREAAAACDRAHAAYLDAPVSGRPPDLTIFVGGERGALARARPVLELLSQKIHYMGPSGSGAVTKIANQYLMLVNFLAAVQCTELGDRHGLDRHRLTAAVQHGSGQSFALEIVRLFVLQGEYSGHGSPLALIRKDIELIDALWGRTELPLWAEVREYYVETMRRFDPSDDFWSAAKVVIAELSDD